jgi:hypothetical protein
MLVATNAAIKVKAGGCGAGGGGVDFLPRWVTDACGYVVNQQTYLRRDLRIAAVRQFVSQHPARASSCGWVTQFREGARTIHWDGTSVWNADLQNATSVEIASKLCTPTPRELNH